MDFNIPTPKTENLYFTSINQTVDKYGSLLKETHSRQIKLANEDLDSGKPTIAGEYTLADDSYAKLLSQLADKKFEATTVPLQKNILAFYANAAAPNRYEEGSRQVGEGTEQPRSSENLHSQSSAASLAASRADSTGSERRTAVATLLRK